MRSDLVFGALVHIPNRYLLCKLTAKATRAFHRPGNRIHDTTNNALARFRRAMSIADLQASQESAVLPNRHRKTAPRILHLPTPPPPPPSSRELWVIR